MTAAEQIVDLGGPEGGRYWRVTTGEPADHPDAHYAAVMARVTGSVGCTYNGATVERTGPPEPIYVSGDWEWNDTLDCYETAYLAASVGPSWNGFATPVISHAVMEALIARQTFLAAADPTTYDPAETQRLQWDGNGVLISVGFGDEVEEEWLMPDEAGNFDLAPLGWTWGILDAEDRVLRRIGALA